MSMGRDINVVIHIVAGRMTIILARHEQGSSADRLVRRRHHCGTRRLGAAAQSH
jgi:hypothetical protein